MFVSILMTILVIGFVRIAINESRQAIDNDLTARAFYAAEAGLEDGIRAVQDYIAGSSITLNEAICDPPMANGVPYDNVLSAPSEFDSEYTCLLIDTSPDSQEASLALNETVQFVLDTESTANQLIIEWHLKGSTTTLGLRSGMTLPKIANWRNASDDPFPAMLRSYLFSYPKAGNFGRSALTNSVNLAYLNPYITPQNTPVSYNPAAVASLGVRNADCDRNTGGSYICRQVYTLDTSNRMHVLRLTALYAPTNVRVTMKNNNTVIGIRGGQIAIDSTGRAGDVYRRVEERVVLAPTGANLLPDFAILSADNVCKNMLVYAVGSYVPTNCQIKR